MKTGVALGSNLGNRLANLRAARQAIVDLAGVAAPILSSAVYEADPIDCEPAAGRFLNAVIEFSFAGDPLELLERLMQIELELGRARDRARNVSRKIDIDLLYVDQLKIDSERLQLPHPRMHLRRFVLEPLADVRPDLILPGQAKKVSQLLAQLPKSGTMFRLTKDW